MLVTVTNTSGRIINKPDTYLGYPGVPGVNAVGGNRTDPLPYPFAHIGQMAIAATKQLPMHDRDWRYRPIPGLPQEPSIEWQQLVQGGVVTLTIAAEPQNRSQEDLFIGLI